MATATIAVPELVLEIFFKIAIDFSRKWKKIDERDIQLGFISLLFLVWLDASYESMKSVAVVNMGLVNTSRHSLKPVTRLI